ncbi:ATP-binding protein, partial [Acidianus sp. RZ1]|uniref:AAA family ATPase n=1 Tax=Acidianus sp. RZ1 TaxID=1540082 RepID=UPI0014919DB4
MLFSDRPKKSRKDLYDREKELQEIIDAIEKDSPLILLLGIRRIGKTSVLNVAIKESGISSIILDLRSLRKNYSRGELYSLLARSLPRDQKVLELLKGLRGIKILGNEVEISWKGRDSLSIAELFDRLNLRRIVIAMDEAQNLRGPLSEEVKNAIAHAYDYDDKITFILTGSQVGTLLDFLRIDDPSSPLYGRHAVEVNLQRFDEANSKEFLRKGFEELGAKVSEREIHKAYELFDGIVGWLSLFGLDYSRKRDFDEIKEMAINISLAELKSLEGLSHRYLIVLKCIADGENTWSKV